jgi:hypothetical protein
MKDMIGWSCSTRKKINMGRPGGKKSLRDLALYYVIVKWTLKMGY